MSIKIKPSPTADTRTCQVQEVSKQQLLQSTTDHIQDVRNGLLYCISKLIESAQRHDYTKVLYIDKFYNDFQNNFQTTQWWELHQQTQRHHLGTQIGCPDDVNLFDVLQYIVDGIVAGMARSGKYTRAQIDTAVLLKAFNNTIDNILQNVQLIPST